MSDQQEIHELGSMDPTKPNAARVYDYYLGGNHNFAVDRIAAEQAIKMIPWAPKVARLQRACLQDIAEELTYQRGFDTVIDFASGLPTQEHIHVSAKPGTMIIYSDVDPVVVEFGREILKDVPNTYIFQADARQPETLLNNPQVLELLQGRRDVAFVAWGLSGFFTDAELTHVMQSVYAWAGPHSVMAFNAQGADVDENDPSMAELIALYRRMGAAMTARTLAQYQELVKPWHADERGFISMVKWHGMDRFDDSSEDAKLASVAGGSYGAYLVK